MKVNETEADYLAKHRNETKQKEKSSPKTAQTIWKISIGFAAYTRELAYTVTSDIDYLFKALILSELFTVSG